MDSYFDTKKDPDLKAYVNKLIKMAYGFLKKFVYIGSTSVPKVKISSNNLSNCDSLQKLNGVYFNKQKKKMQLINKDVTFDKDVNTVILVDAFEDAKTPILAQGGTCDKGKDNVTTFGILALNLGKITKKQENFFLMY